MDLLEVLVDLPTEEAWAVGHLSEASVDRHLMEVLEDRLMVVSAPPLHMVERVDWTLEGKTF